MASNYRPPVAICCPGIKFSKTNFWVDSKIVLKYIQNTKNAILLIQNFYLMSLS